MSFTSGGGLLVGTRIPPTLLDKNTGTRWSRAQKAQLNMVIEERPTARVIAKDLVEHFEQEKDTPRVFRAEHYIGALTNHAILTASTLVFSTLVPVDVLRRADLAFDLESVFMAALMAFPMAAAAALWRRFEGVIPGGIFMGRAQREVKAALLQLFGRDTNKLTVFGLTLVHSAFVALTETVLFRGLILNWLLQTFGDVSLAVVGSSCVSALFHLPFAGTTSL